MRFYLLELTKVSLDVLTMGGSNYKKLFEIPVSTLLQKSKVSQVHVSNLA